MVGLDFYRIILYSFMISINLKRTAMSNIYIHKNDQKTVILNPNISPFEVVERKFRGHPDSMADMVAQSFTQKYIQNAWKKIPESSNTYFPNFSSDKVVLSGASTKYNDGKFEIIKPVDVLLIGKITEKIGDFKIDIDTIFKESVETILSKCLGHNDYKPYINQKTYSVSFAGSDHDKGFYNPSSMSNLLEILEDETHANDTVYVVAYAPLSVTERLVIYLDNLTASEEFKKQFPEIGSDIKAMVRRRFSNFEITMCLPVFPEKVQNNKEYVSVIEKATKYLHNRILVFLQGFSQDFEKPNIILWINTKDTKDKKYYAIWGTALSKGDVGAVGRGNRQQGFISGLRPSTNEAMSGKNPNHFAGIVYQLVAENISNLTFGKLGLKNAVYITANNGDSLTHPNSVDIILENNPHYEEKVIEDIVKSSLKSIPKFRMDFINSDPYERFMSSNICSQKISI